VVATTYRTDAWDDSKRRADLRIQSGSIMVSDSREVIKVVEALKKAGATVIRSYETHDELVRTIQCALRSGKPVIVMPKGRTLAGYFQPSGFIMRMKEKTLPRLGAHRVVIEPDSYGRSLIMAVAPVDENQDTVINCENNATRS
jgi:hypothetical protein